MKTPAELALLLQQKTWDKDVVLWIGSETRLSELLTSLLTTEQDLLDLFDPDRLPMDDDETRTELQRKLRAKLQSLQTGPGHRTVLVVRSIGLLARYAVGVKEFYEWFCNDFAMVILTLQGPLGGRIDSDEVVCVPDRLLQYFRAPEVVKHVYGEEG